MLRWRDEYADGPARLARGTAATRLLAEATGWKQQDIAAALGVTPGAVSHWLKRGRKRVWRGCAARWRLEGLRDSPPNTSPGVTSHPAHVSRLLHALRPSVQRPVEWATQRDARAIQTWWRERWPSLKKAADEGRTWTPLTLTPWSQSIVVLL